eukprot:jgi/Bigna1/138220/aug1.43_g12928
MGSGLRLVIYVVTVFSALFTSQNGRQRSHQNRRGGALTRADKSQAALSTPWLERIVLPMKPTLRSEEDLTTHLLLKRIVVDLKSNIGDDSEVKHLAVAEMYFQEKLHFDCEKELMLRTRGEVSSRARAQELLKKAKGSIPRAVELWLISEEMQKMAIKNDDPKKAIRERIYRENGPAQGVRGGGKGDKENVASASSKLNSRSMRTPGSRGNYKHHQGGRYSSSSSSLRYLSNRVNSHAGGDRNFAGIFDERGRDLREANRKLGNENVSEDEKEEEVPSAAI